MGKSTRIKKDNAAIADSVWKSRLAREKTAAKLRKVEEVPPVYTPLMKYESWFLRDPATYKLRTKSDHSEKQLLEYVRHCFGKYRVNYSLTSVWTVKTPKRFNAYLIDFKKWYICVATGGSLYKEHAKNYFTKKEVHTFLNCPLELPYWQALCFATALSETSDLGEAFKISQSKLSNWVLDPFWKTVIYFFAKNPAKSVNEIDDLVDYIAAKHQESATYSLAGRHLHAIRKSTEDWHYELRRIKEMGDAVWVGHYLPDEQFTVRNLADEEVIWKFHQIKTAKELAQEGNRMRHCVYSYRDRCVSGYCSIWSLTKTMNGREVPKVTLELSNDGVLVQARGLANRSMTSEESKVVWDWLHRHDLTMRHY